MGRYKKYGSAGALWKALEAYFDSISRKRPVMEQKPTDRMDKYGHTIMELVSVKNEKGEEMTELEFVLPPTVGDLCRHLGISRETWSQYCKDPTLAEPTGWARDRLEAYLEGQLLRREGKNLQGVIFSLQNNYGMSEKKTLELGPRAEKAVASSGGAAERNALLRKIAEELDDGDDGCAGQAGTAED